MKLELKLSVILLVFVIIIIYCIDNFYSYFVTTNFKHIILVFLCIILQNTIINFVIKKELKNNSQLFDTKKQVYFIFKNKQNNFNEYYNKVKILKKIKLGLYIKAMICDTKLKNISETELYLKIDNKELKNIYGNITFKSKYLLKREIEKYYLFLSNSEDIYLECETKEILKRDESISIFEYSVIWLSYIVLICQLLGINDFGTETVIYVKAFIILNIADIIKHINVYKMSLKFEIQKYKEFSDSIIKMEKMILDPVNTRYMLFDGKQIPYYNIKDSIKK